MQQKLGLARPLVIITGLRGLSSQGGIETHVRELASRIVMRDIHVEVIERKSYSDASKKSLKEDNGLVRYPFWSSRRPALEAISNTFLAVLWAGWRRPQVLHIHGIGPALLTPLAKLLGLRVVVTHHGRDYRREKWGVIAKLALQMGEWTALKFADEVIAVSSRLSEELSIEGGRAVHAIPNGVARLVGNKKFTSETDYRYVLAVGRLVPEKRHVDLIRAFTLADDGESHLLIAGGADHESTYTNELRDLASNSPRVHLLGAVSQEDVCALYTGASLFVIPSMHEGLPIALLESMAAGCQVVASDIPPHLEVDLPEGSYFPVGNVDVLAAKISGVLQQPPARIDWTQKLARFDWDVVVDQTIRVYGV